MKPFSRREILKTSLLAPAVIAANGMGSMASAQPYATAAPGALPEGPSGTIARLSGSPDRLLLDFGWRFHLGHANDASRDFGFGSARAGTFQKTGSFLPCRWHGL